MAVELLTLRHIADYFGITQSHLVHLRLTRIGAPDGRYYHQTPSGNLRELWSLEQLPEWTDWLSWIRTERKSNDVA